MYSRLQYISQGNSGKEHAQNIEQALNAGCKWIQLRMKDQGTEEIMYHAGKMKLLCKKHAAIMIINDNVSIAKMVDADGVHLGLADMPVIKAREILGSDKIIGGTANTLEDVVKRINEKCNYIGLGPFRFTQTKKNLSPILGMEGYHAIISQLSEEQRKTPIYAIGGINKEDQFGDFLETGIYGIAVSGMITHGTDKKELINNLKLLFNAVS